MTERQPVFIEQFGSTQFGAEETTSETVRPTFIEQLGTDDSQEVEPQLREFRDRNLLKEPLEDPDLRNVRLVDCAMAAESPQHNVSFRGRDAKGLQVVNTETITDRRRRLAEVNILFTDPQVMIFTNFNSADLQRSVWENVDFGNGQRDENNEKEGKDVGTEERGASFVKTDLRNAQFVDCNLGGVDFSKANIEGIKIVSADRDSMRGMKINASQVKAVFEGLTEIAEGIDLDLQFALYNGGGTHRENGMALSLQEVLGIIIE